MFVRDGVVVCSASDLKAAVECEWAVLRRLDAKLGRVEAVPDPVDALNRRAAGLGDEHEARQLAAYVERFGTWTPGRAGGVAAIERPEDSRDAAALRAAQDRTLEAIRDGADVVFQATLFSGDFLGFADFLLHEDGAWVVCDTKLARRARVTALLQLAAYARELEALGVPMADEGRLLLGDGRTSVHSLADVRPVFDARMDRLRAQIADRLADGDPIAWGAADVVACGRCAECAVQVEAGRDVLLVGRLTVAQRDRLRTAGVRTIEQLAESAGPVAGIGTAPLARLRLQARLQLHAERSPEDGAVAEVVDPAGLAALPEPDRGDVFFDFEGDPLWTDDTRTWGLEYLFGVIDHDGAREHFRPFWAHDRAGEKQALLDFLHYLQERRRRHPDLHVYHYADYERSHLQQLCARHGVGEAVLDELLTAHVLVDLYPIVLRSIRTSQRSYGLKKLEPLYMGERLRESDVTTGADSVDAYVRYAALVERGEEEQAAAQLREIADYNEYDCASTLGLRDWLLRLADERGVVRRRTPDAEPVADRALQQREGEARDALLAHVADVPRARRTPAETAIAMAAAAIEYHRREDKSFWWEHFDREIAPVDDWAGQKDVLVVDQEASSLETGWRREGRQRSDSRTVRLVGALAVGSGLQEGDDCFVMYDDPVPAGCDAVPSGQRGEHPRGRVRSVDPLPDGRTAVVIEEAAGLVDGTACEGWDALPFAITPRGPINTKALRDAILGWGERLVHEPARRDAVLDLLRRDPPRTADGGPRAPATGEPAARIVTDLLRLDGSYLAVQGPPGSGKTHVGAAVIAALARDHGWRVGVVAQSHQVVENLLDRVVAAGLDADRVGKRIGSAGTTGDWTVIEPNSVAGARLWQQQRGREGGFVVGGTAWAFANPACVPAGSLDLLVVDEAGQYSLANTIAVGVAARNLLLLGDPQQLPQVSQGLHPEPVDTAALAWLAEGHRVLPDRFGVFLGTTWRMRPELTAPVSALAYEGRLHARLPETADRVLAGSAPGVHAVPLPHTGRTVESPEEAQAVLDLVRAHLGRPWTDPSRGRDADPLTEQDVIVVAPFNAQVALIRGVLDRAGLRQVRVGTVDRFQGQQAVIAIVSLTASSAVDVPRGLGFVLSRNRLNVAISRAQWASHLIHSPALADHLPPDADAVAELGAFLRLVRA